MRRGLAASLCVLAGAALAEPPAVSRIGWLNGDTLAVRQGDRLVRPATMISDWLQLHLPEGVRLEPEVANADRSWALIRQGERACVANAVRLPERERLAYFSTIWLMPPPQLIVRRERRADLPLDSRGAVDLARLMANESLRGVVARTRSYGATLDAQLAAGPELSRVTSADFGSNLLPMLLQDRADYTVEYPNVLVGLASQRGGEVALDALPIKDAGEAVLSGVACPRTPWGHAAIRLIDKALGTPEGAAMLREALRVSLPADTQRAYREAFDAHFQRRAKPTPGL
jgi:uncharacterized protein (TIGR02285 family)